MIGLGCMRLSSAADRTMATRLGARFEQSASFFA
jgi:hypothetical protein